MESFFISLKLSADFDSYDDEVLLEKNYQSFFKPILTFLYSHENFLLTIEFTGYQLHYYSRKHPESIDLLRELYGRKQIEILGSGYYNPVFPILFVLFVDICKEENETIFGSRISKRLMMLYIVLAIILLPLT